MKVAELEGAEGVGIGRVDLRALLLLREEEVAQAVHVWLLELVAEYLRPSAG